MTSHQPYGVIRLIDFSRSMVTSASSGIDTTHNAAQPRTLIYLGSPAPKFEYHFIGRPLMLVRWRSHATATKLRALIIPKVEVSRRQIVGLPLHIEKLIWRCWPWLFATTNFIVIISRIILIFLIFSDFITISGHISRPCLTAITEPASFAKVTYFPTMMGLSRPVITRNFSWARADRGPCHLRFIGSPYRYIPLSSFDITSPIGNRHCDFQYFRILHALAYFH